MPEAVAKGTWTKVAFGDVVQLSKERSKDPEADGIERYVGLEHIEPGDLRIRSWGDVAGGTTFTTVFRPGQVLFGKRRSYQRKVAVADFSGVCSSDIYVLEPKGEDLLPELLPFICQTDAFFEHAVGTSAGSLSPRTNWKDLATFEFALPPLEEQRRIAEVLRITASNIEALRRLQLSTSQLSEAYGCHVLRSYPQAWVQVGDIAKFTSGKQIRVSGLPQEPSDDAAIPVYGGNGVSGYTDQPLADCIAPTVVIGRVGQFCGAALVTGGAAWITDNALYPKTLDPQVDVTFLAMCLKAANLNRGKLGEYLPLVTQKVVHSARIPKLATSAQRHHAEQYMAIEQQAAAARRHVEGAYAVLRQLLASLSGGDKEP